MCEERRPRVSKRGAAAAVACALAAAVWGIFLAHGAQAAVSIPSTPQAQQLNLTDDAMPPPTDSVASAGPTPIGLRPTNGPGAYDVVVVALNIAGGTSAATADNSPGAVGAADSLWNTSTTGGYRLDYRTFTGATYPQATCDLAIMDDVVDQAVSDVTAGGTPRPGRVGLLIAISTPWNPACPGGYGWVGASSFAVNGYWDSTMGDEITAHEAGHNFKLGHSGAMMCSPDQPQYPSPQAPAWPCAADATSVAIAYGDREAMMGMSGTGLLPKRITASQLQVLGLVGPESIVDVGGAVGTYDISPPQSASPSAQTLRLTVPGSTTGGTGTPTNTSLTLEYRTATASGGGPRVFLDATGDVSDFLWGANSWVYPGAAANSSTGKVGMTAGTSITLADGRTVTVQSTGTGSPDSATPTARVAVAATVPSAPSIVSATPGNGQATIAFTPPASTGGSPIVNYEYSTDSGATWVPRSPGSTASPLVISSLVNGHTYGVELRAVNGVGHGAASGWASVTPRTVPSAPTNVVATPGNGQARVAFTPPASDGGASMTNLEYTSDGGSTWVARSPASTASPVVISGLVNGVGYHVSVRAVNAAGAGAPGAVASVTPNALCTVPAAPTGLTASTGSGSASVSFSGPPLPVTCPVTNYEFTTDDGHSWTARNPASTSSPVVIAGLSNWTVYPIRLRAISAWGVGPASEAIYVIPRPVPGPPTALVATPGDASASIAFLPPSDTGGAPITNYAFSTDNGSTWSLRTPPATTSPLTITGLVNGTNYPVRLRAINSNGTGDASVAVNVTPVAPSSGAVFVPLSPVRAYDSRSPGAGGRLVSGGSRSVDVVAAVPQVPAGAVAISYNVTVTDTDGPGFVAVAPGGTTEVAASSVNWDTSGATLANGYVVALNAGKVVMLAGGGGSTQVVLDVTGYYEQAPVAADVGQASVRSSNVAQMDLASPAGSVFVAVDPARAYDSREPGAGGPLATGQSRLVSLARTGLPSAATGVAYNLTVADTNGPGYLSVTPGGTAASGSTINWTGPGQVLANGSQGQVANQSVQVTAGGGGSTQFIIDVVGYFEPASAAGGLGKTFTPLAPVRSYDSRVPGAGGALATGLSRTTSMRTTPSGGSTGVPAGAVAVVYNLTETQTLASGYLAVAPFGATTNVSTINWFRPGQTQANGTTVKVSSSGQVTTTAGGGPGSAQYVIDVAGYYR